MADYNFDLEGTSSEQNSVQEEHESSMPTDNVNSSTEIDDVSNANDTDNNAYQPSNTIRIGDRQAPVIILFGTPASGKSMTLVRLARYLRKVKDLTVAADRTFKSGESYVELCNQFERHLNTRTALPSTKDDEFLMVKIYENGRLVAHILEAPGEHFFKPLSPKEMHISGQINMRPYLTKIIDQIPNRRIWAFLLQAQWGFDGKNYDAFVDTIRTCKDRFIQPTDRTILLYNQVDVLNHLFKNARIMPKQAELAMRGEYSGIDGIFKNTNPITSLWKDFTYFFVPFSTGTYSMEKGEKVYTESKDYFPEMLWETLKKCIKG